MKRCPFCQLTAAIQPVSIGEVEQQWRVMCSNERCGAIGPIGKTEADAEKWWDRRNPNRAAQLEEIEWRYGLFVFERGEEPLGGWGDFRRAFEKVEEAMADEWKNTLYAEIVDLKERQRIKTFRNGNWSDWPT